jgi:hypothetical protein
MQNRILRQAPTKDNAHLAGVSKPSDVPELVYQFHRVFLLSPTNTANGRVTGLSIYVGIRRI